MEARKVIGIVCAVYAVLMAISIVIGFINPFGRGSLVMRQVGGVVGLVVSAGTSWYMLRDEKVVPLDESSKDNPNL
jgi:hypothetical protein